MSCEMISRGTQGIKRVTFSNLNTDRFKGEPDAGTFAFAVGYG